MSCIVNNLPQQVIKKGLLSLRLLRRLMALQAFFYQEEEQMPDLTKCKYVDGRLCCWDKKREQYIEVVFVPITSASFYKEVVATFNEDKERE